MIMEYNVKHKNNIDITYFQIIMCCLFVKIQQLLLLWFLLRLVKIIIVHSELINWYSVDPCTLFQKNIDKMARSRSFKNK
jgi:hypothetical protein